jgi:hypothetical protein
MREEVVRALDHPLFRNVRRRGAVDGVKQDRAAAAGSEEITEAALFSHYAGLFGWPGKATALDESTIAAMVEAFDNRLRQAMGIVDVFIVAPAMHRAVVAASATIDGDDLETLTCDDIAWENGFLAFPRRVQIGDSRGWRDVDAISWQIATHPTYGAPVLYVHYWSRSGWVQHIPGTTPKLWPAQIMLLPLDQGDRDASARHCLPHDFFRSGTPRPGWTPDDAVAEAGPDNEYGWVCESGPDAAVLGYLFAFLRIAAQPMAVAPRCREQRPGTSPQKWEQVRVVQLRRFHHVASVDGAHHQVNWKHSWVVRMHKVRQWYPSLGRHQVIFRGPYIKGPTNAPLLAGEKVQALVR